MLLNFGVEERNSITVEEFVNKFFTEANCNDNDGLNFEAFSKQAKKYYKQSPIINLPGESTFRIWK